MNESDHDDLRRENANLRAELAGLRVEVAHKQADLDRVRAELRRATGLNSLFLVTVSHELRTPLTSIIGSNSMLLRERPGETLSPRQRDHAERALKSARRLATLINDAIDLSLLESGRLALRSREFDLMEMLKSICAEYAPKAAAKGLVFRLDAGPNRDLVTCDAERLRQVLSTFVLNAITFTKEGGVTIRSMREADRITVTVQDTGIGMSREQIDSIVAGFAGIDKSGARLTGGAGLGLTIARLLVELMGGRLSVISHLGKGTTFAVEIPVEAVKRLAVPARDAMT